MPTNVNVPHGQGALRTLLPPPVAGVGSHKDGGANPIVVSGRTYTAAIGSSLQVPAVDAVQLVANGWTAVGDLSGTTAQRPTGIAVTRGTTYLDTTLGALIVYDGAAWRNTSGAAV